MDTSEIVLSSEAEANDVLKAMQGILKNYEVVTFADLLELVGLSSTFADNKLGWTRLINVEVKPVKDGYILDLLPPKAV